MYYWPVAAPNDGLSKALDTIVQSEKCKERFHFSLIDLGSIYKVSGGSISLDKIAGFFRLRTIMRDMVLQGNIDTYYLTIAQSTVGVLRDLMILNLISKDENKKQVIVHLHGGGFKAFYQRSGKLLKYMINKHYRNVTKAIVLGDSLRGMFEGILPDEKIEIVPNCVDDEFLISEEVFTEKQKNLVKKQELQILYLSNMIKEKGYLDVFAAAESCLKNGYKFRFVFAGKFYSDAEAKEFSDLIQREKLSGVISYVGVVAGEEKKQLLKESDIFVLPTYYPNEGQPITILEAMSAGMPVVCTNHAGIQDLIVNGTNGVFVDKQKPDQIECALVTLNENREMMKEMGKNNREKVLSHFTEKQYIDNIVNVLS